MRIGDCFVRNYEKNSRNDDEKNPGGRSNLLFAINRIVWHGDNENGRSVSQGIYFIRIKNLDSNKTFCKKVLKISW